MVVMALTPPDTLHYQSPLKESSIDKGVDFPVFLTKTSRDGFVDGKGF